MRDIFSSKRIRLLSIALSSLGKQDALGVQSGFATLMAVIIVGAIGAAVAVSFLSRGIEASKSTIAVEASLRSRLLAEQCVELALQEIRNNTDYSGSGASSNDAGACTYEVSEEGGTRRNIMAVGRSGQETKKFLVEIEGIEPKINVLSWREIQ